VTYSHTAPQDSLPQALLPRIGHGEGTDSSEEKCTLHAASCVGGVGTMRALLDGGADVNKLDAIHRTPVFQEASQSGTVGVSSQARCGRELPGRD